MKFHVSTILFLALTFTFIANAEDEAAEDAARLQQIESIYQSTLGRPSDPDGLAAWNASGLSTDEIQQQIAGSEEGQQVQAILANTVAQNEINQANIDAQNEINAVTSEAQASVSSLYQTLLGRAPDKDGLDAWTNAYFANGGNTEDLASKMMLSPEYLALHPEQQ